MAAVVEVEGAAIVPGEIRYNIVEGVRHGHLARFNRVGIDFFEAFDVPLLMGRSFQPSDVGPAAAASLSIAPSWPGCSAAPTRWGGASVTWAGAVKRVRATWYLIAGTRSWAW